ncbi:hypothetical protein N7532_003156 [Penicillium argentinense]|uniref:DUF218 domain-containing protein n=1 Tax=Penicillium argentinense TaxID=1131581 RepID=A0A9W9FLZ7_9EURO|nr:uncharacterized protein N7532_003156 [Penicillium argentinense]KAJ5102627.1 hypothetical protein N7532_003156 [Penicillium argentinense]
MVTIDSTVVDDINSLSTFLSDSGLETHLLHDTDCIVLCASAVLYAAEEIFKALGERPSLTKCLVLCGGIGHSTPMMYDAVRQHPRYSRIGDEIQGLPEARVLEWILDTFFDRSAITREGCEILVEDQSTNCGQNAIFTRNLLEKSGYDRMKTCIVIQDPTMMLRTYASFRKVFGATQPGLSLTSCPMFIPRVQLSNTSSLKYKTECVSGLWEM